MTLGAAYAYAYAGVRLAQREMPRASRGSWRAFTLWWRGIAVAAFATAASAGAGAIGFSSIEFHLALRHVSIIAVSLALWGLMYHLLYGVTGRNFVWFPLLVFYASFYGLLLYDLLSREFVGATDAGWEVELIARTETPISLGLVIFLLLAVPPLVGALFYYSRRADVDSSAQRLRIALVSVSVFVWAITAVLIAMPVLDDVHVFQGALRVLGIVNAMMILSAFDPPAWLKRRLDQSDTRRRSTRT